jgi:outer membrane protein assembly factor BamB
MKFSITHGKQTASIRIAGLMLAIAPLWLMLIAANRSAGAQTPDDVSNSSAATTAPSPADWTQFHRDNMQRWNPYETVLGVSNVGSLQLKWTNPIGEYIFGAYQSSPAVVNGVIYFGSDDGNVYALNANTGAKLWNFPTYDANGPIYPVNCSPAVVNGVVYITGGDGNLYALNTSTGAKLWSYFTGFESTNNTLKPSPAVVNGVVYVGGGDGAIALNSSTGTKLWSFPAAALGQSSPAVANGVVYIGGNGTLYALNASTGAELWSFGSSVFDTSPAVTNGVVYISRNDHVLSALNASTGAELWSYTTGDPLFSSPAVANGVVYFGSADGNVYALNASTGAKLWSFTAAGLLSSAPAVANGVVYINTEGFGSGANGNVYALNASTGAKLWSYGTIGRSISSPTVVNGVVYVRTGFNYPSVAGNVYAFALGGATADLFLRIQPTPTTVHQGDLLTYAFPVWNLGPNNAVHEVLNTQVPAGTTFDYIRISGTPGLGTCTTPPYQGTGQIVCHQNAAMAPNTTWTVRLTVKVTAAAGTVITANAATMADTPDPNMANNTATVSLKVQ